MHCAAQLMSRAVVTVAIGSLNAGNQNGKIDFHLVKKHFDSSETVLVQLMKILMKPLSDSVSQ